MAVSEDKSKLIGLINYMFSPCLTVQNEQGVSCFERLQRKIYKFQRSIDKNASICISTELAPVKIWGQNDYIAKYFEQSAGEKQSSRNFGLMRESIADNMGMESIDKQTLDPATNSSFVDINDRDLNENSEACQDESASQTATNNEASETGNT